MPERRVDEAGRHEHRGFRRRMGDRLEHAAGHGPRAVELRRLESPGERKHQKEVPDLGDGRIRDEQLQARLPQCHHVADENGRRTERAQQLSRGQCHDTGKHVEPEPHDEEPRSLDDQCRERGARRGRRTGVCRRQPQVQRKERGLGQQPRRHRCRRRPRHGVGTHPRGQQRHVHRAVGAVQQEGAQQIQHGAQQREEQVAQCRAQRLAAAVQAHERHARKGQELQRDVEREHVAAHEHEVERPPDREQEQPERQRSPRLPSARRCAEIPSGVDADAGNHHGHGQQHDHRQPIGAQGDAERRRPATEQIDQRVAGAHRGVGDGDRDAESEHERRERHALRMAAAEHEPGHHAGKRQQDRQHEEIAVRGRHVVRSGVAGIGLHRGRGIGCQRDRAGLVEQSQQQRDRQRRGGEGDDNRGDQQRLRYRVAAHPGGLPPARDDAAQQEHAVADQIEREDLPQRLRVDDESVEPETHEPRGGQAEQRGGVHDRHRSGAPMSSNVSVSASEGISATSMTMMSGLAKPSG